MRHLKLINPARSDTTRLQIAFASSDRCHVNQHFGAAEAFVIYSVSAAVYCNAVGASAIRQLLAAGVQPLKVEQGELIEDLLKQLSECWQQSPPVWLNRALRQQHNAIPADERFSAMLAEGWQEDWPPC